MTRELVRTQDIEQVLGYKLSQCLREALEKDDYLLLSNCQVRGGDKISGIWRDDTETVSIRGIRFFMRSGMRHAYYRVFTRKYKGGVWTVHDEMHDPISGEIYEGEVGKWGGQS